MLRVRACGEGGRRCRALAERKVALRVYLVPVRRAPAGVGGAWVLSWQQQAARRRREGADSQVVVAPKIFPFELGETIPVGHRLNDPLPVDGHYPEGFEAWFAVVEWAYAKNNKKPITVEEAAAMQSL